MGPKNCRLQTSVIALFTLFSSLSAQGLPNPPIGPPSTPPPNPSKVVFTNSAVKALVAKASVPERQEVTFSVRCDFTPPAGCGIAGYEWMYFDEGIQNVTYPSDALIIISGRYSREAVGRAREPGIKNARCGIRLSYPDGHEDIVPSVYVWGECGVIGGYLTFLLEAGSPWTHVLNDKNKPYYLQYFNYDPRTPPPTNSQKSRSKGTVSSLSQPEGTVYTWSLPSDMYLTSGGTSSDGYAELVASKEFAAQEAKCAFQLTFVDSHGVTQAGSGNDTTTETARLDDAAILMQTGLLLASPMIRLTRAEILRITMFLRIHLAELQRETFTFL